MLRIVRIVEGEEAIGQLRLVGAAATLSDDFDHRVRARRMVAPMGRLVAHVDELQVLTQRDLVAERGSQEVGVCMAPDISEQGLMIDAAACLEVQRDQGSGLIGVLQQYPMRTDRSSW